MELYLTKFYKIPEKLQPGVSEHCSYLTASAFILFLKYTRKAVRLLSRSSFLRGALLARPL